MATHPNQKLYAPEQNSDARLIFSGEQEPGNEYELQQQLLWQYYKQQQEQRGKEVSLDLYIKNNALQREAYQMWEDHGLEKAFRALVNEQRPAPTISAEKTQPADGADEREEDETLFVPDISLEDVLRRRAQAQAR